MKLKKLLRGVEVLSMPPSLPGSEAAGVSCDSRHLRKGDVFVAVRGGRFDGHDRAADALRAGAAAVVLERDLGLPGQILVPDSRAAYGVLCANLYGNPSRELRLIGVTGTNGKTTTTTVIKQALEAMGHKAGLIGTIHNEIGDLRLPARYTTPDPLELHALLSRMVAAGCSYAVMEVSSHALAQQRLVGCRFAAGVFTNLTQDHLDYHGTMEEYYQAKSKLFRISDIGVVNYDDPYGRRLAEEAPCKMLSFSAASDFADYTAKNIVSRAAAVEFELLALGSIGRVSIPMPGMFSVQNALAAAGCLLALGLPFADVVAAVSSVRGVKGRAQVIPTGRDFTVVCDYAHTPDGLEKILSAVGEGRPGRLITLFGAAGERDARKRPQMGAAVARHADFIVLTSDNPRSEDPEEIMRHVASGFLPDTQYVAIADRYEAIHRAVGMLQSGDILVLAGKGHEDYQVLGNCTVYFDEEKVVEEALREKELNDVETDASL